MFLFPSDERYEGDEYERFLRGKSGASNPKRLLNMLQPNEINEDLQKMNDAQLDRTIMKRNTRIIRKRRRRRKAPMLQRLTMRC